MPMSEDIDILVTLSTFSAESDTPLKLLEKSGFEFRTNPYGRRMKPSEAVEFGRSCRGLIAGVEEYSADSLAQLPNLRCISRCGSGIGNIALEEAKRRGIAILNTPDEPTVAVAELTLGIILALLRQLPAVNSLTRQRKWQRVAGRLLEGKIVGIVGLGRIGRRVAELVRAFGAAVIAVDPRLDNDWVRAQDVELLDLSTLLARADIVSIHAAQSREQPLHLGAAEFALMKPGAWLVNMARGDMVDDVALAEALASERLSGAGLDVFPQEPYTGVLCDSDRVILSPHQATLTVETRVAMEIRAVENVVRYLRGEGQKPVYASS